MRDLSPVLDRMVGEGALMADYAGLAKDFIISNFLFGENGDSLGADDSFLETGVIDSTGILEVVAWVEETFGFRVADVDLVPENFDSITRLGNYIARTLASRCV